MKSNCSVVIPVYNSEKSLKDLMNRLIVVMKELFNKHEIILVNDGSSDKSWEVISNLAKKHPQIIGINLRRNYGQHNALLCGIRAAKFEYTLTMDDDLQHPPEEIHKILSVIQKGFDVVYGIPKKMQHSSWRNFFSKNVKLILARIMGIPRVRDISSFRLFRTDLRDAFSTFKSPNIIVDALLSWGTTNFGSALVDESPRPVGESNYNFIKLAKMSFLILTGFSTLPLRFASLVGFSFTIFGFFILIYVIIRFFIAGSIPGFPFLASIITIFSGTQLFALGIFGEYLSHIFERSTERPPYVIERILSKR